MRQKFSVLSELLDIPVGYVPVMLKVRSAAKGGKHATPRIDAVGVFVKLFPRSAGSRTELANYLGIDVNTVHAYATKYRKLIEVHGEAPLKTSKEEFERKQMRESSLWQKQGLSLDLLRLPFSEFGSALQALKAAEQ